MAYSDKFLRAIEFVLQHEGGYVNDPTDSGGETNFGISKRSYPNLNIKELTRDDAIQIYHRDWWVRHKYEQINDPAIATKILDMAVNMGPQRAHTLLQQALHAVGQRHVNIDGIIGPQTISAANNSPREPLLAALRSEAANYYRSLVQRNPNLVKFRDGWLNRAYS